jgi:uncharacterized membrane protein YdjX (TVP38/TMEM64 family)
VGSRAKIAGRAEGQVLVSLFHYFHFYRLRIEVISQFISPITMVPIKMQIPINPYPIPLQPPINKLIMIMDMLIMIRAEKPALRYLSFCIEFFRTIDATANKMLIPNKIKMKNLKPAILPPPELTYLYTGLYYYSNFFQKSNKVYENGLRKESPFSMKEMIIDLFESYTQIALVLSLIINIIISLLGVVPSVFLTAANLAVFGLWGGIAVSFAGEAIGAAVAFILYRKGFRRLKDTRGLSHPKVQKLLEADGKEAFSLILALRILPFVPSGLVTFIASIGKTSFLTFFLASTLGKIPAILIEGFSIYQIINMEWEWRIAAIVIAGILLIYVSRKFRTR